MMWEKSKKYIALHISILIFSATGIFSKMLANSINHNGLMALSTAGFSFLMLLNCGIYAIFWQQNLKSFPVNIAYAHKAIYNVWSLMWAVLLFSEKITVGNIIGTLFIVMGILVMQNE